MQFLSKLLKTVILKTIRNSADFTFKATSAYFCFFCIDTIPNTEKLSWTEVLTEKLKNSAIKKYCKSQMLDNQEKEINKGQKFCTGRIVIIAITTRSSIRVNFANFNDSFIFSISPGYCILYVCSIIYHTKEIVKPFFFWWSDKIKEKR